MKVLITFGLLLLSVAAFTQTYEYSSYFLGNNFTKGKYVPVSDKMVVSKLPDGKYEVVIYDPTTELPSVTLNVEYNRYDEHYGMYLYKGIKNTQYVSYQCLVACRSKLSAIAKGQLKGSGFDSENSLVVSYARYAKYESQLTNTIALCPSKN